MTMIRTETLQRRNARWRAIFALLALIWDTLQFYLWATLLVLALGLFWFMGNILTGGM